MKKKLLWKGTLREITLLAEWLHKRYEKHAKDTGWQTQKSTQVDFENLPEENKETMIRLAEDLMVWRKHSKKRSGKL